MRVKRTDTLACPAMNERSLPLAFWGLFWRIEMEQKLLKIAQRCAFSLCVLVSLGALVACGDDGDSSESGEEGTTTAQGAPTGVRVFAALDGTPSVDVVFLDADNNEEKISGVSGSSASSYLALSAGTYRALLFAGSSPLGITVENVQVTATSATTLAFSTDGQGEIKNQIFEDNLTLSLIHI